MKILIYKNPEKFSTIVCKKLFIIFFTLTIFISCDKDTFKGNDQLPPETQIGANTVGCLVNGKVFIPKQEGITPSLVCNYELIDGEFYFNIAYSDSRNGGVESVSINHNKISLQNNTVYLLNKNTLNDGNFMGGGGTYFPTLQNFYRTNLIKTGELKITKIDLTNSIISGTFWFDATNTNGEIVQVRSGRFDMNY